jgi:oxygen-dependent protoporphyrinogen oxidase
MHSKKNAIVIGAGPAGLSAAAALSQKGIEVLVLEKNTRSGGSLATAHKDGFLVEGGPNSLMLEHDGVETFFRELGLTPLEAVPAAGKRFLVCGGRPVAAPSGPLSAITTPLLSWPGKFRILLEPFARHAPPEKDESVSEFVSRRLGTEAARRLVDPMVSGIYAGDIEKLSLHSAFPRLHLMEQQYGSLIRAGFSKGRAAPKRRIVNFPGGMEDITNTLARTLGAERVRTGAQVTAVGKTASGWDVEWRDADGSSHRASASHLLLAVPPWAWADMPLPAGLAEALRPWHNLKAPPLAIVSLGYAREHVAHPLDGFGMLAPGQEKRKILGTLFQSSLFPGRAPEGAVLLTSFVGGTRQSELAHLDDTSLVELVRNELQQLLGAKGAPEFVHITKWERAIPQYNVGYSALHDLLNTAEREFPGLRFCGNYCAGIALPKTILHAIGVAGEIAG